MAVGQTMKRFYKVATVEKAESGWTILLDGRPIKTPAARALTVPTEALGAALAQEWARQPERIDVQQMHLTRLVNVALDRTPDTREAMADEFVRYCETDLLCFLAEDPEELVARQRAAWRPVRDWAGRAHDIVLLEVPGGLLAAPQPPASLDAARRYALGLDDFALTGLLFGTGLFGSALVGLGVAERFIDAGLGYEHSILDELWQAERWGADDENIARQDAGRAEAQALDQFFSGLMQ